MNSSKLQSKIQSCLVGLVKEIKAHKIVYFVLFIILSFSAFFRLYRLNNLLGFWYDQGRDALVIWDFLHYQKFFLIGPVTGIEGIFLGPFYYYLLAPFYWLGGGSPVMAAAALSWLTVGAIFLIYLLGKEIYGREVGLLAAFLYGFSYDLVVFSRWLANPNPLPFFTLAVLLFLYLFVRGKDKALIGAAFLIGLCLQLEAASAVWFLPATLTILVWQKRVFKKPALLGLAFLAFLVTLLPQIFFNFRHQGILQATFQRFLVGEASFSLSFVQTLCLRLSTYYDAFFGKFGFGQKWAKIGLLALFSAALWKFKKNIFSQGGKLLFIWLLAPLLGFLFYRGNHGYVWDYYFTGIIPAFIILFAAGIYFLAREGFLPRILIGLILMLFGLVNLQSLKNYYQAGIGITLRAQLRAIDWVFEDAKAEEFNIDAYVPPKIFYSYSYLFRWYGQSKYGREPQTKLVKNLYTLYEPDGEHPQFLQAWLERQDTIGRIIRGDSWGGVTVQKRERIRRDD